MSTKQRTSVQKASGKSNSRAKASKNKLKAKSNKAKNTKKLNVSTKKRPIAKKKATAKKSSKILRNATQGMKYVMNLAPNLKELEEKMLPAEFIKVLAKIEKTLEEFNSKIARKL